MDPLAEAEKIAGLSSKDNERTSALGFLLHRNHVQRKESALKGVGDSYCNMDLDDSLALYERLGFQGVLVDEFEGVDGPETYHILWRPEGLLATVESYRTTRRNSSKVYYNLRVTDRGDLWSRISSGRLHDDDVWVGDHDGREGIATSLDRLREVGEFLPVWVESPFLWLVNYAESKVDGYDYKAITAERLGRLPAQVRAMVGA